MRVTDQLTPSNHLDTDDNYANNKDMDNDNRNDDDDGDENDKPNTRGMTLQPVPRYQNDTHAVTEAAGRSIGARHQM